MLARFVHHPAGADDFPQEGVGARVVVLAGGVAYGRDAAVPIQGEACNDVLSLCQWDTFKIRRNHGCVEIAPFIGRPVNI